MSNEIPMMAMAVGVIIPLAVFVWLYFEEKRKAGHHARNCQAH